jgi:endo-1,4-beta-xylanase
MSGARPRHPRLAPQPIHPSPRAATAPWPAFLLAAAFAALGCGDGSDGDDGDQPWDPSSPVRIAAEDGTLGASVMRVTDAMDGSITYVTATMNVTDPPADMTDPRISSQAVTFPAAGAYQIYGRVRIGPEGGNDDSFFINIPSDAGGSWQLVNGISGFDVAGAPGHRPEALVQTFGGSATPGVWKWALLGNLRFPVPAGQLTQTFSFATREDGLDIDAFAFALVPEGATVGFTTDQLDAGEAGVLIPEPDPYEPPADQPPLVAAGSAKWLGSVCCGVQRPFLENYFNQITPENGGKWGSVEAVRDEYNWAAADEALALAEANGFPFRYHVLLWGSQQPDWIETLPPEEQLEEIREWFTAVNERYGARIQYLEVVNEFDNQPPSAEFEGKYTEALGGAGESGFDWIINAFRMAREIFPASVQLMLNEYSVINTDERTALYLQVVERLQQEDLIDAIGEQGHAFSTGGPVDEMIARIDQLSATGLPMYITEMDIDGPPLDQLIDFQRLFPAFWEHPNIMGITLWGYREGHWRTQQQAPLVHANGAEKPALRWLKGYLRNNAPVVAGPATAVIASSDTAGTEVATFSATDPSGAAYPAESEISWGVVQGPDEMDPTWVQALAFSEGTGRLELVSPLQPGIYRARVYADVDATVSNFYDLELTVE